MIDQEVSAQLFAIIPSENARIARAVKQRHAPEAIAVCAAILNEREFIYEIDEPWQLCERDPPQ